MTVVTKAFEQAAKAIDAARHSRTHAGRRISQARRPPPAQGSVTRVPRSAAFLPACVAAILAGCVSAPPTRPEVAPLAAVCPDGVPTGARCLRGQDSAQAHYLIVMPEKWSGVLVVHAHGGPDLGEPGPARADADIKRWAITVQQGHAWAGSVFRQGGFAVGTAAEDTERVRRIFVQHVNKPRRTLLHGQSWGAMVATKAAEQGLLLQAKQGQERA